MSTVPKQISALKMAQQWFNQHRLPERPEDVTAEQVKKAIEIALAEQQESEYITAAQPDPVDPHAALRAKYAKQVAEGTTGFYLWGVKHPGGGGFGKITEPYFHEEHEYRCTDISCHVSKEGEPAIRMLRTEAQKLQRELGDTVDWRHDSVGCVSNSGLNFQMSGTYTYRTKATIKLDGKMVTPEQAAAEWAAKKETHDIYSISTIETTLENYPRFLLTFDSGEGYWYETRPKQPTWTGSRDDVIALLKEMGLL